MGLTLVLGGVRSGKSEHAERLVAASGLDVVYVATGAAGDAEMAERIARHRRRRPSHWRTIEAPDPLSVLGPGMGEAAGAAILVDGLSGWVATLMQANGLFTGDLVAPLGQEGSEGWRRVLDAVTDFARLAEARAEPVVVVADEVGLGGVPQGAGARRFVDLAGESAQVLAHAAGAVWLVVAGQPLAIKGGPRVGPPKGAVEDLRLHGDTEAPPGHLDFAVNVVPGGPPPGVAERLTAALGGLERYPDETAAARALAARHGREPGEVLLLNGAAEAFWLLAAVLSPRHAVCVHPSFTEPEAALRAAGSGVARVFRDPDDFHFDPAGVDVSADLVVVGNPNNPTGTLDPAATLASLARPGRVLVVDEAFMDFCPSDTESLSSRAGLPGTVVVRSLTKIWGLPGVRAGYLLGPADLVARLREARQPWSVNALALAALEAYGLGVAGEATAGVARQVAQARSTLARALRRIPGVRVWDSAANFLLLEVWDGPAVRAGLRERRIAVRRAGTFPGLTPHHLRVAVRTPADNSLLVAALRELAEVRQPQQLEEVS